MPFKKPAALAVLCLFALALPTAPTAAATIEVRPDLLPYLQSLQPTYIPYASVDLNPPEPEDDFDPFPGDPTVIKLTGVIEKGDAEKLDKIMHAQGVAIKHIVFESPGGNFLEGIKIGELLQSDLSSQDPMLAGVYVLKGQECLSACALAFSLAAANRGLVEEGGDARYLEDGAALGFHMGALSKEKSEQSANVKSVMDLTYSVVAAYAKLIKGNLNPPILLEEALKHRDADSFFYLRGGQRSQSMGFTPVTRSVLAEPLFSYGMNMATVEAICGTLIMSTRTPKTLVTYDYMFVNGDGPTSTEISLEDLIELRGSRSVAGFMASGESCYVTLRDDKTVLISVAHSGKERSCKTYAADGYNHQAWCASDNTGLGLMTVGLLADTMLCHFGELQTEFVSWMSDFGSLYEGEKYADYDGWKRTVTQDVNVRQTPSLKADIVKGLVAGDQVQVTNCQLVDDAQGVWYQIDSPSGNGWISARFVWPIGVDSRPYTGP